MRRAHAAVIAALGMVAGCLDIPPPPGGDDAVDGPDEDEDGVLDAADLCPTVAGPQGDRDGDGIGDACDFDPDAGGEIAVFYGFTDGIGDLQPTGPWMPSPDEPDAILLGYTSLLGDAFLVAPTRFRLVQIEIGFRIADAANVAGGTAELALLSGMPFDGEDPDIGTNVYVTSYEKDFDHRTSVNASDSDIVNPETIDYVDQGFLALAGRLLLDRRQVLMTGTYQGADQGTATVTATRPSGSVGVLARNAVVELHYLYAVGLPP